MSGWPAPDKSGYPANPEQNGWHWIQTSGGTEPWYWLKDQGDDGDFGWEAYDGIWSAANIAHSKAIYLGPCLTPSEVDALKAKIARLRRGWLRVIQQENSCPATGGGCLAKRCGCVEEMEMLANEAALDLEVKP